MVIWAESKCSLLIFQPSLKEQSQGKMSVTLFSVQSATTVLHALVLTRRILLQSRALQVVDHFVYFLGFMLNSGWCREEMIR